jgi:hypothetical protein
VNLESAPPQRNIDPGDHAFNTVLDPFPAASNESAIVAFASALQIDLSDAQALVEAGKTVPVARSHTRPEAEMIAALVRTCGLRATVIPDNDMMLDRELLRARRISVGDDEIRVYHSGIETVIKPTEIKLLVLGELSNRRVDYTERISSRQGQSGNVLDTSEYHSDETLLDIYAASLDRSLRIKSDAFDYSGLVSALSFRSDENFRAALETLKALLPLAKIDDDFARVRKLLERAWPERSHNESRGIKRTGLAFRAVAQASVVSNNRDQFDRYSRLMFLTS